MEVLEPRSWGKAHHGDQGGTREVSKGHQQCTQQSVEQGFGRTFGASSRELLQLLIDGEVSSLLKQNDCGSAQLKKPRLNPYSCLN
jgi:hypothetical protein